MFDDVVLQDTRPEDWPEIRKRILKRVLDAMGFWRAAVETWNDPPPRLGEVRYEVLEEYEKYGLRHRKIRFSFLRNDTGLAVVVLPKGASAQNPVPAVMICHGTYGWKWGKWAPLCLERLPDGPYGPAEYAYSIELARRGFATVTPDNYKCGELLSNNEPLSDEEYRVRRRKVVEDFAKEYPEWTFDGLRMVMHRRLLDVMDQFDFLRHTGYGVLGHSLGGRMAVFLSALDERIGAAVPSAGISTHGAHMAYGLRNPHAKPPPAARTPSEGGSWFPYDYQDIIALSAPRPLLVLEAYNDELKTYKGHSECYVKGQRAYALLGKPECFCTLTHGDGHQTLDDVREFAYRWFERWLPVGAKTTA